MIFKSRNLSFAINHCKLALSKSKLTLPDLKYIRLTVNHGTAWLIGSNLTTTVNVSFDQDGELDCLIPANILDYLKEFDQVEITFSKGKVTMNYYEQVILTTAVPPVEDFYTLEKEGVEALFDGFGDIITQITKSIPFCTSDEMRPAMQGINIVGKETVEMCASDGHTLINIKTERRAEKEFDIVIPKPCAVILSKFKNALNVRVGANKVHAFFKMQISDYNIEVTCRLIGQKYPDFKAVIPTKETVCNSYSIDRKEFLKILKFASIKYGTTVYSQIDIEKNVIKTRSTYDMPTVFEHEINTDQKGTPEPLRFTPLFAQKTATANRQELMIINYSHAHKPCLVYDGDTMLLIMPVIIYQ